MASWLKPLALTTEVSDMQLRFRLLPSLLLPLFGLGFALAPDPTARSVQDEAQDEEEINEPYTAFLKGEQNRITKKLTGAWQLVNLETQEEYINAEDFRGFAMFHDGYLSMLLMGAEDDEFLLGLGTTYTVLTGAYRFQVSEDGRLQLASMIGIDNGGEDRNWAFHRPGDVREFEVLLTEDDLTLWEPGRNRYEFRRLNPTGFPIEAADRLREKRTSWFDEEGEPENDDY